MAEDETAQCISEKMLESIWRLADIEPELDPYAVADSIDKGESFVILHDEGFSVVTPEANRLYLWVACAYQRKALDINIAFTDIIKLAELLKLQEIAFNSSRKGWKRLAPKLGFEWNGKTYTRRVS